jgi:hypothetical protein
MRLLLQRMGFELTEKLSDDSAAFTFQLNGHKVAMSSQAQSMQLGVCFKDPFDPMKANQWNREHFSTRVYLDEHGCTSLGSEAKFGGRVTDEMLEELIHGFLTNVTIFAKFVTIPAAAPSAPAVPPAAGTAAGSRLAIGRMEWSQAGQNRKAVAPWSDAAKPVPGLVKINRNISLKYDPHLWRVTAADKDGRLTLTHASGNGHAVVIAERIDVSRGSLEDVALANAQAVDPKAKVVFRDQRRVNGVDVRFLKIEADADAVPTAFWGCFYGGEYGTVQVVTYAAKTLLAERKDDFMELLNGFTVSK